ncbi:MAG: AEC family transporter [Alphaproteobacteria bacterium]|nr:AEC family transporter [Alphaproteobacteria bacterium]
MQSVVDIVLPVFAIILTGYLAGRFRLLGPASAEALNRFVFYFALPPLLFLSMARVPIGNLFHGPFLTVYIGGLVFTVLLGLVGARFLFGHRNLDMIVLHATTAVFGNTGYLGIPLFLAAFGPDRLLPAVLATVVVSTVLIGAATAAIEIGRHRESGILVALGRAFLAVVRSPLVFAPVAGIAASAIGFFPPQPVVNFFELLGATAGPGALFALGLSLVGRWRQVDVKELGWLVALKLVVHPLATLGLISYVVAVEPFWAKSAVLLAAMPTGALVFVLAQTYDSYVQRASAAIVATTVLSVLSLSWLLVSL